MWPIESGSTVSLCGPNGVAITYDPKKRVYGVTPNAFRCKLMWCNPCVVTDRPGGLAQTPHREQSCRHPAAGRRVAAKRCCLAVGETVILRTPPLHDSISIETPATGRGGCSRMALSPTAISAWPSRARSEPPKRLEVGRHFLQPGRLDFRLGCCLLPLPLPLAFALFLALARTLLFRHGELLLSKFEGRLKTPASRALLK